MTKPDISTLRAAIFEESSSTELECQKHAPLFAKLLLPTPADILEEVFHEEASRGGRTDFTITFRDGFSGRKCATIWEAKAPQAFLFQRDASLVRLKPTDNIVKAETQLVYYVDELNTSPSFRSKHGLSDKDDVRVGGIIIGISNRLLKSTNATEIREAQHALWLRNRYIYAPSGIRLLHWDNINDFLTRGP